MHLESWESVSLQDREEGDAEFHGLPRTLAAGERERARGKVLRLPVRWRSISNGPYRLVLSKGQPPRAAHFPRRGCLFFYRTHLPGGVQPTLVVAAATEGGSCKRGAGIGTYKGERVSKVHNPEFGGAFYCDAIFHASWTRSSQIKRVLRFSGSWPLAFDETRGTAGGKHRPYRCHSSQIEISQKRVDRSRCRNSGQLEF